MFQQQDTHWIPKGFHGTIPYPTDGNVVAAIQNAVKTLLPRPYKTMAVASGKYAIVSHGTTKQIVFEIDD